MNDNMQQKSSVNASGQGRREYAAPKLETWGAVSKLTQLGGSGGPGDALYNPQGKLVGNAEDGSIFPPNFTVDDPNP